MAGIRPRHYEVNMSGVTEIRGDITGVTIANPPVVTSAAHGLSDGNIVRITQLGGTVELNNGRYRVNNTTTDTFELQDPDNHEDIDASDFTTYTSGGRWNRTNRDDADRVFYEA